MEQPVQRCENPRYHQGNLQNKGETRTNQFESKISEGTLQKRVSYHKISYNYSGLIIKFGSEGEANSAFQRL